MPRVPYDPIPTAQPTSPGERLTVNTPPAAFGANIGAALEHLGSTEGEVGNEIFARATAFQQLANENASREALTGYMTQQGQMLEDYKTKMGPDATNGLPQFNKDSRALLSSTASGLASPMAKKMFLDNATSFFGRNVILAGGHAAVQNKQYTIDTFKSQQDLLAKVAGDDPLDDKLFEQRRQQITDLAVQQAALEHGVHDPSDPIVKDSVSNAVSRVASSRILGLNQTNPPAAEGLLKTYQDKGYLTEPDLQRVTGQVELHSNAVASSNIVDSFMAKHLDPSTGTLDVSASDAQKMLREEAASKMPGSPLLPSVVTREFDARLNQQRYSVRADKVEATTSIQDMILKNNITDVQALIAMPNAAAQIQKLDPKIRANAGTIQDYINRTRDAAYKTTQQEFKQRALGLSTNDVEKFVSTDFTTWPLSRVDLAEIQNKQAKLVKNSQDDPRVMHAQSWMRGAMGTQLQALGIYSRNANNTDDYDHYTGALQEAIQEFQEEHKHAPTYKDVIERIGPQVINTQTEHKGWLWNSQEPAFKQWTRPQPNEVPPEFRQQITKDVIDKGGVVPSEDQLYRAYIRQQFQKLYGGKGARPAPAKSE